MTISRERREELLLCDPNDLTSEEFDSLLADSAWRERVERQANGLADHWGDTARQLETSNGVTESDRRVADSMRALSKELRSIVDTGDEDA